MINHIESAFRYSAYDIIKKQGMDEEETNMYQSQINDLLQNPTFIRVLTEKRMKEEEKEGKQ